MTDNFAKFGFLRTACAAPKLKVADVDFNVDAIKSVLSQLEAQKVSLALFPELSLSGYTCADLFYQAALLDKAKAKLLELKRYSRDLGLAFAVGLPLAHNGRIYNCAAVINAGSIRGLVPKTYLPNSGEFYDQRWFASGAGLEGSHHFVTLGDESVPLGIDLLFSLSGRTDKLFGLEICEDLWAVSPPSNELAKAGALLILNPSASNEVLGKAQYRKNLVLGQSARCLAGYLYASAGPGESSTDTVFSGHCLAAENGLLLAESERFSFENQIIIADFDLQKLEHERQRNSSFAFDARRAKPCRTVALPGAPQPGPEKLLREISRTPFVPPAGANRAEACSEIFKIQSFALAKRLKHAGLGKLVVGLSGGLDSTLAFLVCLEAVKLVNRQSADIAAITLPGPGTSERTLGNARKLAGLFGASLSEIDISPAVSLHFQDIGQDPELYDVTFENSQARERTQILMDLANKLGGLVVGTGDLSEAALGWCTYNGDQMSMYGVNAGVPKTLVRYIIEWYAAEMCAGQAAEVLRDVLGTPVSPELLPRSEDGSFAQETEKIIGPYLLLDFFLYYFLRHQFAPEKILYLAKLAFAGEFGTEEIKFWLRKFLTRFFSQQFKRSATPDCPKVGSVALSPRADWRMPSDAEVSLWLAGLED